MSCDFGSQRFSGSPRVVISTGVSKIVAADRPFSGVADARSDQIRESTRLSMAASDRCRLPSLPPRLPSGGGIRNPCLRLRGSRASPQGPPVLGAALARYALLGRRVGLASVAQG